MPRRSGTASKPYSAALSGMPLSAKERNLFNCFFLMHSYFNSHRYSYFELFAYYAKHLERFFCANSTPVWYACEFHHFLLEEITSIAQRQHHSPSREYALSGEQLEALYRTLVTAKLECEAEHSLGYILNQFKSRSVFSPNPEEYPKEYEIYKQCCPNASEEAED